jgi:hypothetical protein
MKTETSKSFSLRWKSRTSKSDKSKSGRAHTWTGNAPQDGELIASTPGWELYLLPVKSSHPWKNLKLISTGKRKSRANFLVGHDGHRFADATDSRNLAEFEPEIYEWAHSVCVERLGK